MAEVHWRVGVRTGWRNAAFSPLGNQVERRRGGYRRWSSRTEKEATRTLPWPPHSGSPTRKPGGAGKEASPALFEHHWSVALCSVDAQLWL